MPAYTFYRGQDSLGSNIGPQRLGLTVPQLGKLCNETAGCVGFSSSGWLKSAIKLQLDPAPGLPCDGLFIKGARW